ncbi:uncharacterized protein E0L32_002252 [Thyridium curvatum]|uniref:Acyltransferase 3 domain-containing protein n=1 Tax=Thyridium curvatum TaxID=1093900 RepID=A0A507AKD3_9PEZI|nr:uncharacterized protein E0L32_002252 [Thyridium curvatum]TPX06756.1 hypothetical protein E0L32_002252 [Thyridium curvatum]
MSKDHTDVEYGQVPGHAASRQVVDEVSFPYTTDNMDSEKPAPALRNWRGRCLGHATNLRGLLPSFLLANGSTPKKLHPSAWLDGLRGTAAFFVGYHVTEDDNLLIQLPFLRYFVSGLPQVMIFFVISGYALSYKPLKLARQRRFREMDEAMASAAFRRHARLFLPAMAVTFIQVLMVRLNWYGQGDTWYGTDIPQRSPGRAETFMGQVSGWWHNCLSLASLFDRDPMRGLGYDPNLWTLTVEWEMALILFLAHVAFSRLRSGVRMALTVFTMWYCMCYSYWQIFLFFGGMLACDVNFALAERAAQESDLGVQRMPYSDTAGPAAWANGILSSYRGLKMPVVHPRLRKILLTLAFVFCYYLLSIPRFENSGFQTPGYKTLYSIMPKLYREKYYDNFWIPIASVVLIFTLDRAPFLQRIFTGAVPQYLGKISFALYLVHGPLIYTLGWHLCVALVGMTGRETDGQYGLAMLGAAAVFFPVCIWAADVVTRYIDTPSVNFGRWLYEKLIIRVADHDRQN